MAGLGLHTRRALTAANPLTVESVAAGAAVAVQCSHALVLPTACHAIGALGVQRAVL